MAAAGGGGGPALMEEVMCTIRACLKSVKGEIPMETLAKDYKELVGRSVPFRELEHATLASLLQSNPQEIHLRNRGGKLYACLVRKDGVGDHITQMVQGQRTCKKPARGHQRAAPARHPKRPSAWVPPTRNNNNFIKRIEKNWAEPFKSFPGPNYSRNFNNRAANPNLANTRAGNPQVKPNNPQAINPQAKPHNPQAINPQARPPNPQARPQNPQANNPELRAPNPRATTKNPSPEPLLPTPKPNTASKPGSLFYNDGTWLFPRAVRNNQEKQYAPYFEVPPRFSNKTGVDGAPGAKTYKQQLEEEMEKLSSDKIVFRTIPCGKKKQYWLSTVTILDRKVTSFPMEKERPEEAEELVAKNALEILKQMITPDLPTQNDMDINIQRIRELLSVQSSKCLWWRHVRELYQNKYQEVLPQDWVSKVDQTKAGLVTENIIQDRWMLRLANQDKGKSDGPPMINYLEQHLVARPEPLRQPAVDQMKLYDMLVQQQKQQHQLVQNPGQTMHQGQYDASSQQEPLQGVQEKLQQLSICKAEASSSDIMSTLGNTAAPHATAVDASPVSSFNLPFPIPTLDLPLTNFWDVYVTCILDFNKVKIRLIEERYNNGYDDLVTDMELHYMEDKNLSPVTTPLIQHVYAANHDDSWFRIQVLAINDDKVMVHFIDHGDEEEIEISQLHNLERKFFELPAQSVRCSLAGLEYSGRDRSALTLLQTQALGQNLVGQVVARPGVANDSDTISLILFNTSTDEDININEMVLHQLDLNYVEPTLPQVGGVAEVYVMHVTTNGNVYVQVETETFKLLENLLKMAQSRTEEILSEIGAIDPTRLYLAQFSEDGQWYRAAPRSKVDPDGKVLMWFVDFGNSDRVPTSAIRPLHGLNERLTKIPHQALLCRLHNVPGAGMVWTERACQRLMDLLPYDSPMLLKVQAAGGAEEDPPTVELFKRLQPQNELVSINATLALDTSLFRNEGDSNNNSVNKEVVLSPSRSRSRRSSTNSQTSSSSGLNSGPSSMTSFGESSPSLPSPGTLRPMDMPEVGTFFDVLVTFAANPSNFAVQSWKMNRNLTTLMEKMRVHYAKADNLHPSVDIQPGGFYAVKHTDGTWYRAQVNMHQGDIVSGIFVDYGDCFIETPDNVQPLPTTFHALPYQAIKAKLAGVSAANLDWTPEDTCRFRALVEYREFVSLVSQVEQHVNGYVLHLQLIDTSTKEDLYIDQVLIDEGRAVREQA